MGRGNGSAMSYGLLALTIVLAGVGCLPALAVAPICMAVTVLARFGNTGATDRIHPRTWLVRRAQEEEKWKSTRSTTSSPSRGDTA